MLTDVDPGVVADLQRSVAELTLRVSRLESELAQVKDEPAPLLDETVLAISAAVAAYLGKRATIRHIRLASKPSAWAAQGRSAVQHSHVARAGRR